MVEIYLLEQLDALARKGTLSAASEELHLTQPTLTRSMQKLEQEMGAPLFHRENRKIALNENGLLAAEYAARILSMEQEMRRRILLQEKNRKTLSFGAVSPGPVKEVVPQLSDYLNGKAIHAEINQASELLEGLKTGLYQMIALNYDYPEDGYFCRRVCSERIYYSFLPVEHPVGTEGVTFRDINGRDILMPADVGFWKDIIAEQMPDSTVILQEGNELLNLVAEHSSLPAFSSDVAIRHNLIRPNRVSVPILDDAAKADYYCVCRGDDPETVRLIRMLAGQNASSESERSAIHS